MAGFLYPRTADIRRARTVAGSTDALGDVGYSGEENSTNLSDPQGEIVLFTGVLCAIQADSPGRPTGRNKLAQDATELPRWKIIIPLTAVPPGQIRDRDI